GYLSTFVDNSHLYASQAFRSPFAATEEVLFAEYQEWLFQNFLKCTKIENETTYNFKFKLLSISEQLHLPISFTALATNYDAAAHSKIH
ncbi:hypothetical protein B0O99DRAFT_530556, partial [Bisporella sp. PMI_857]